MPPATRTEKERSPRKIFCPEHLKAPPGTHPAPILHMHVTKARVSKLKTAGQRMRFIAHLEREFAKAMAKVKEEPMPPVRGNLMSFFHSTASPEAREEQPTTANGSAGAASSSATHAAMAKPEETPPRPTQAEKEKRRAKTLATMPPSAEKLRGWSPRGF